jgi:hypothetical protein
MKTLFHLCTDENNKPRPAVFVDGNGRKYTVPFDEPTEILSDFMAEKIIEHCHYYGIIEVMTTKTREGIQYNMKDARARAMESLEVSEKACINDYIRTQLEDRVRANFPPLPPQGRALECCVKHQYNLLKAGIRCIGWEPPYAMADPGFQVTAGMHGDAAMQSQITSLQTQLLKQNELIMQLLTGGVPTVEQRKAGAATAKKKGGPALATEPEPANDEQTEPDSQSVTL